MLKLLNLHTVVFRQYKKKILRFPYCTYFKWASKFKKMFRINFISLSIFISKHKAFYKQNFLEYTFQRKISKLSIGSFIEIIEMYVLSVLNNRARAQLAWKQLTHRNQSIYNFMVIMKYRTINGSLFISLL